MMVAMTSRLRTPGLVTRDAGGATLDTPAPLLRAPGMHARLATFELRAAAEGDSPTFEGWAVRWDVRDTYGTSFQRGCFVEGGLDQDAYALLWMHDPSRPIGTFTAEERDRGLWIAGQWDDTTEGRDSRVRAKGSAPGLSVGFVPIGVDPEDDTVFTSARLIETSQITRRMASVPGAGITDSRSDVLPTREAQDAGTRALALVRLASAAL